MFYCSCMQLVFPFVLPCPCNHCKVLSFDSICSCLCTDEKIVAHILFYSLALTRSNIWCSIWHIYRIIPYNCPPPDKPPLIFPVIWEQLAMWNTENLLSKFGKCIKYVFHEVFFYLKLNISGHFLRNREKVYKIMRFYANQTNILSLNGLRGAFIRRVKWQRNILILRAPWAVIRGYTVVHNV